MLQVGSTTRSLLHSKCVKDYSASCMSRHFDVEESVLGKTG